MAYNSGLDSFTFFSTRSCCRYALYDAISARPTRCPAAAFLSALCLQHCRQPSGARARGRDFGSNPVAEPHAVKAVTVMSYVFNCLQVHYGVPADLDERIAA
jgi:hypothetical protein